MEHSINKNHEQLKSRIGFHYFPDHLHYRMEDLERWVPILKELGAAWLILRGEAIRAIPEEYIRGLSAEGIEPIIHFPLDLANPIPLEQLQPMLTAYAKWGVRHVIFFERPNLQSSWGIQRWSQPNIVAAFVDLFLPLAQLAVNLGLNPFFPPLEPGGQYWDTVFLQQALEEMQQRGAENVLANMGLSAYTWTWGRSLDWGAGGAEMWPHTKPYRIPPDSQDQRSLRTYEWYQETAHNTVGKTFPVILLQAGLSNHPMQINHNEENKVVDADSILKIFRLLKNENVIESSSTPTFMQPIGDEVLCGNFYLLSCDHSSPLQPYAWFGENGKQTNISSQILNWIETTQKTNIPNEDLLFTPKSANDSFSIARYLYFPSLEYFLENEQRMEIQEYLIKYQPTIGFSLKEAAHAAIVDIAAEEDQVPDGILDALRQSGCSVRRLWNSNTKEVNEDYGEELADFPDEKEFQYVQF